MDGLLGPERRKTGWMRAEAAGDSGPLRQQAIQEQLRRLHHAFLCLIKIVDPTPAGSQLQLIRVFGAVEFRYGARLSLSRSGDVQDAAAQQVELGAAMHLPFQQLQAVDMPFGGTVAPRMCQRRPHGIDVAQQALGKATQERCFRPRSLALRAVRAKARPRCGSPRPSAAPHGRGAGENTPALCPAVPRSGTAPSAPRPRCRRTPPG